MTNQVEANLDLMDYNMKYEILSSKLLTLKVYLVVLKSYERNIKFTHT